jgi:hypothetical protein
MICELGPIAINEPTNSADFPSVLLLFIFLKERTEYIFI